MASLTFNMGVLLFPAGDKDSVVFDVNFVGRQAVAAEGQAVAGFEVEAITVSSANDFAVTRRRSIEGCVLVRAEVAYGIVATVVIKECAASFAQEDGFAGIRNNLFCLCH